MNTTEYRESYGGSIVRSGESLTLDQLEQRRRDVAQQRTTQARLDRMARDLETIRGHLQRYEKQLEQEQRQAAIDAIMHRVNVSLGLEAPDEEELAERRAAARATATSDREFEEFVFGRTYADLDADDRVTYDLVGFVPRKKRLPYRELSMREMQEQEQLKPWRRE